MPHIYYLEIFLTGVSGRTNAALVLLFASVPGPVPRQLFQGPGGMVAVLAYVRLLSEETHRMAHCYDIGELKLKAGA